MGMFQHQLSAVVTSTLPELWTFELKFHCFCPDARPAQLASRPETEIGCDALSR
jgi:hypothetical protein